MRDGTPVTDVADPTVPRSQVLIGGVSQLYQGDLDLGRRAIERLQAGPPIGPDVALEDLHYGAVAVFQRIEELSPTMLLLVGAEHRGRVPGSVHRRRVTRLDLSPAEVQIAVGDAVTGYVGVDLILEVVSGFGALPERTITLEVEPSTRGPGTELSEAGTRALVDVVRLARLEAARGPLFVHADQVRARLAEGVLEPSPARAALEEVCEGLELLDHEGRWGDTLGARDRLRAAISAGDVGEAMSSLDWALWWTLIEELDRLQAAEAAPDDPLVS